MHPVEIVLQVVQFLLGKAFEQPLFVAVRNLAQLGQQGFRLLGYVNCASAAIVIPCPPFQQPVSAEPIDEAAGRGFGNFERLRDGPLRDARLARDDNNHLPLRTRDAEIADLSVKNVAQQPRQHINPQADAALALGSGFRHRIHRIANTALQTRVECFMGGVINLRVGGADCLMLSDSFDDDGWRHAASRAHGDQAIAAAGALQFVKRGADQDGAGAGDGVAKRD